MIYKVPILETKRLNEKLEFIPYKTIEESWFKNGIPITDYKSIMNKSRFDKLYGQDSLEQKKM